MHDGWLMSIAFKINELDMLMNTFSLCFCTSLFVENKYGIIKLLDGCL
jgi:hypothetical protein